MKQKSYKGFKPLVKTDEGIIFYSKGYLWIENNGLQKIIKIRETWKENNRLTTRLFRTEPKCVALLEKGNILLAIDRKLIIVDINKNTKSIIWEARNGFSTPLNICSLKHNKWCAIWGDYGSNVKCDSVTVYGLSNEFEVEEIYKFDEGTIRHIHNIIPALDGTFYIFTGDYEATAGIYKATNCFENVNPIVVGKQIYRAVVGFDTHQGLLYATDAVNEQNYIYLLDKGKNLKIITKINGSCIYGCEKQNKYFFSTTVEPDENRKGLLSWFSSKRGKGIFSNEVQLICVDRNLKTQKLIEFEKDLYPMKLFQYGVIQFVKGNDTELWIYPVAVKKYDGIAILLNTYESD